MSKQRRAVFVKWLHFEFSQGHMKRPGTHGGQKFKAVLKMVECFGAEIHYLVLVRMFLEICRS